MINKTPPRIIRLPVNATGKDWIIGDIHGFTEDALLLCKAVGVAENKGDRVFLVGDIIDRGPMSAEALGFAKLPNWHIVRGNHEQLLVDSVLYHNLISTNIWLSNGGDWIHKCGTELREAMAHRIEARIPSGILVVGNGSDRFYVTHAEIIPTDARTIPTDELFDNDMAISLIDTDALMWGRRLINYAASVSSAEQQISDYYKSMGDVYVGHSKVGWTPRRLGNHVFLDTGCCSAKDSQPEGKRFTLTIACHQTKQYYQWDPLVRRVINSGTLPQR